MKKPLTIRLVTANRPETFTKALHSIAQLNYKDIDIIIGDDSNNPELRIIANSILKNTTYLQNIPPRGEVENSNHTVLMAQTEYVCLFHDDDLFEPEHFDELMKILTQYPDVDMAYTGRIMINEEDKPIGTQLAKNAPEYIRYNAKDILDYMILGKKIEQYPVYLMTPGLVFKRSLFERIGGFDASINTHYDTDFMLKALLTAEEVLFLNKPLYKSRVWHGISGRTKSSERGEVFYAEKGVIDNFISFCKTHNAKKYLDQESHIYDKFAHDAIAINGPLGWISLRYKGSFTDKIKALMHTARGIIALRPSTLLNPKFYVIFIGSIILPRWARSAVHKMMLKIFYHNS